MRHHRPFLALWLLAVTASVAAFVLYLALRGRSMHLGYELGRTRAEQARLREVRRVLELEVASQQTPQRVALVARSVLGMEPPTADRIISLSALPLTTTATILPRSPLGTGTGTGTGAGAPAASDGPFMPLLPAITLPKTALLPGTTATSGAR